MSGRLTSAMVKPGTISALFLAAIIYRSHSQGTPLLSPRIYAAFALCSAAFAVALAWQMSSRKGAWTWSTSFLGFTLSLVAVSLLSVALLRVIRWGTYPHSGSPRSVTNRDVSEEMKVRAAQAVEEAAKGYNTGLDLSPESVEKVEGILGQIHERYRRSPLPRPILIKESLKWGGYIGEVIGRVRPCHWALDSEAGGAGSFPVVFEDKGESFPVRWCYKRIVNGEEDNVWHKFRLLVVDRDRVGSLDRGPAVIEDSGRDQGGRSDEETGAVPPGK